MQWPDWFWSHSAKQTDDTTREALATDRKPPTKHASGTRSYYTTPQTITACVLTTATTLTLIRLYKTYLRRIPTVNYLKPGLFRHRTLYGYVTSVGDADNFHLFHTPGGRLAGWGWFRGRKVQDLTRAQLRGQTVHVRLAGVDAPELGHFGKATQPFGPEALEWLRGEVLHRYVRVRVYRRDQYERVVGMVWRRKWVVWRADVGYEMLKQGWATVYEAKFGSEFGDKEELYRAAEKRAKEKGLGMWQEPSLIGRLLGHEKGTVETPREYKTRTAAEEKAGKIGEKGK